MPDPTTETPAKNSNPLRIENGETQLARVLESYAPLVQTFVQHWISNNQQTAQEMEAQRMLTEKQLDLDFKLEDKKLDYQDKREIREDQSSRDVRRDAKQLAVGLLILCGVMAYLGQSALASQLVQTLIGVVGAGYGLYQYGQKKAFEKFQREQKKADGDDDGDDD